MAAAVEKDRLFSIAVDTIYQGALDPSCWPISLQAIANVTGDVGAILIYGREDGSFGVASSPSMNAIVRDYEECWSTRDIRAIRTRERGYFLRRDAITDRDVLTPQEINSNPFYTEFLKRHGLKFFAAAMVSPDPKIEVGLSVQRLAGKPAYTDDEVETVRILGRHVERALRLSMKLIDAELLKVGLGTALDRVGIGVVALDSRAKVIFSNAAASDLINQDLNLAEFSEHLNSLDSTDIEPSNGAIQVFLRRATGAAVNNGAPILIPRAGSKRALALYRIPVVEAQNLSHGFLEQAQTIVLLVDPEPGKPPDPALLRDLLGLTLGEARVAALVGHGLSPRETATHLGIAEETARTVLKTIFAKVNVSRQSELVALMARLTLGSRK